MWIDGVDPLDVLEAFVAAGAAMLIFGVPAACTAGLFADYQGRRGRRARRLAARPIVASILLAAIIVNVIVNVKFSAYSDRSVHRCGVWAAIFIARCGAGRVVAAAGAFKGSVSSFVIVCFADAVENCRRRRGRRARWASCRGVRHIR